MDEEMKVNMILVEVLHSTAGIMCTFMSSMACSPVGLISPVIAKARVPFPNA